MHRWAEELGRDQQIRSVILIDGLAIRVYLQFLALVALFKNECRQRGFRWRLLGSNDWSLDTHTINKQQHGMVPATGYDRQVSMIPFSKQISEQDHCDQMIRFIVRCQCSLKLSRSWETLVYVGRDSARSQSVVQSVSQSVSKSRSRATATSSICIVHNLSPSFCLKAISKKKNISLATTSHPRWWKFNPRWILRRTWPQILHRSEETIGWYFFPPGTTTNNRTVSNEKKKKNDQQSLQGVVPGTQHWRNEHKKWISYLSRNRVPFVKIAPGQLEQGDNFVFYKTRST